MVFQISLEKDSKDICLQNTKTIHVFHPSHKSLADVESFKSHRADRDSGHRCSLVNPSFQKLKKTILNYWIILDYVIILDLL